jgi:hypothetical protein
MIDFSLKILKGRGHLEDLGLDGRVVITWNFKKVGTEWALVKTVMKLGFHKMKEISSPPERLSSSEKGLCSMELIEVQDDTLTHISTFRTSEFRTEGHVCCPVFCVAQRSCTSEWPFSCL